MQETTRTTHPAILVAAAAVTVASLTAIASLTGLLPGKSAAETPPAVTAAAPVNAPPPAEPHAPARTEPAAAPVPAAKPHKSPTAAPQPTGNLRYAAERSTPPRLANEAAGDRPPARSANSPPICRECGTVEAVREVSAPAEASGLGAVAGGVLGGLLGNQMGQGKGNTAATIVGAAGGAFAGHQTEKYVRTEKHLEVTVRFENGHTRTITQDGSTRWQIGDRVRLSDGRLLPTD